MPLPPPFTLPRFAISAPGRVLAAALLLTVVCAAGMTRLTLRTDGRALVPAGSDRVQYDRQVRDRFGVRDPLVVLISSEHEHGIFNPVTLQLVRDLTAGLAELPGIRPQDLLSLATEKSFRFRPGTIHKRGLLEIPLQSREELLELQDDLARIELYTGTIVARDGRSTVILVGLPEGNRLALYEEISEHCRREEPAGHRIEVIGAPAAEALLGNHVLADLGVPAAWLGHSGGEQRLLPVGMVPVAVVGMGLVFLLAFRRPAAALLPLAEVGCCLLTVFGLMGWLGQPVYITTAILPVIITAVGVADEVHVFRRFLELCRQSPAEPVAEQLRRVLDELASPVVQTSITTAVGFLSFALSPLAPVRSLGLFAALGVVLCMLWSLTVIPAIIVLTPASWWLRRKQRTGTNGRLASSCAALGTWASRHRAVVLVVAVVLLLSAVDGVRRVRVQDSWIDGFAEGSSFARATRRFEAQYLGSHTLLVTVDVAAPSLAGTVTAEQVGDHRLVVPAPPDVPPQQLAGAWVRVMRETPIQESRGRDEWSSWIEAAGPGSEEGTLELTIPRRGGSPSFWLRPQAGEELRYEISSQPFMIPAVFNRVDRLERFLAGLPGVGGVLGPARYLATAGFMTTPDRPGSRALPADPKLARIRWNNYEVVRGSERVRQLVDADYRSALISVFLQGASYRDTARLLDELCSHAAEQLAPHGISIGVAGDVAVSQAMIDSVVRTQVISLLLALLGILATAALLGGSLRRGLLALVPPLLAVILSFAGMGWLGVPLGVATSMFAAMTLGVGVDFAIHLCARHRRTIAGGVRGAAAVVDTLRATGPAIVIDAAAVSFGFSVMLLSQVPANARLGGLLVAGIGLCLLASLLLIPALLTTSMRSSTSNGHC